MKTKTCTSCKMEKTTNHFQVRRASKDGLTSRCKACLSIYDKSRANNPNRVKARIKYSKTERGKEAARKAKKKYSEKHVVKRAAHIMTGNAIRDGKIKKGKCEICGSVHVNAHHDDYSKPLDVRWLCPKHHKQWHLENGEGMNA